MKKIKIFLASSVNEFANDRRELKDFVRRLSDVLIDSDIRLQLFICEYADNAISAGRMQAEYNKEIDNSDIFVLLVGDRLGEYTLEEYEYALQIRDKNKNLRIIIALNQSEKANDIVKEFKQRITNEKTIQLAELRLNLTNDIAKILEKEAEIKISNSFVVINGKNAAKLWG
jgi:predicted Rossmann-fold nucleotide-binding protein